MATDLGKVGIVMKGDWSNSATYEELDAVSYNNGLYIAKQAVPANTVPTNTTYWQLAVNGVNSSYGEFSFMYSTANTATEINANNISSGTFPTSGRCYIGIKDISSSYGYSCSISMIDIPNKFMFFANVAQRYDFYWITL